MSKRKLYLAILLVLGVSLLNVAVLINASNQESQLSIDASDQRPVPVYRGTVYKRDCNAGKCDIVNENADCKVVNGKC